jgi:outer membrane receptor for ferrienterochelin and colicin
MADQISTLTLKVMAVVALVGSLQFTTRAQSTADSTAHSHNEADYYRGLSLSNLIDLKTTVASGGWEQRTSDAPGAVTAYDASSINIFGYYTIGRLADITPGYSTFYDNADNQVLETRGATSSANEKHLVLVDDIPVNHVRNNRAPVQSELPLLFAHRVEFLRGPASALYGIGAFNGVINVIPKHLTTKGQKTEAWADFGLEAGTPGDIGNDKTEALYHRNLLGSAVFRRAFAGNAVVCGDNGELQLAYGYQDRSASLENGYDFNDTTGTYATNQPRGPWQNNETDHFFRLQSRVTAGPLNGIGMGFIGLFRQSGLGVSWSPAIFEQSREVLNYQRWITAIPYMRYDRSLTNKMRLNAYAKINYSQEEGAGAQGYGLFNYSAMASNLEFKAKYSYDILENVGIIAGVNYDMRGQDSSNTFTQATNGGEEMGSKDYLRLYNKIAYTYSAFAQAQAELPVLNGLILTAGLRSDNGNLQGETYHQVSPRAAIVLKPIDYINVKAMYATAFKAPGQDQISLNKEKEWSLQGTTAVLKPLRAEAIHSLEGNLTFSMNTIYASGSYFFTIIDNAIERRTWFRTPTFPFYQNVAYNSYSSGGEIEVRYMPRKFLGFWASGSYTRTWANYSKGDFLPNGNKARRDTTVQNIIEDIPSAKTYIGINYQASFGLSTFAVFKRIWSLVRTADTRDDAGADFVPGYSLVDLKLTQRVSKNFSVEAGIENLLNQQYSYMHGWVPGPNRTLSLALKMGL